MALQTSFTTLLGKHTSINSVLYFSAIERVLVSGIARQRFYEVHAARQMLLMFSSES